LISRDIISKNKKSNLDISIPLHMRINNKRLKPTTNLYPQVNNLFDSYDVDISYLYNNH